MLLSNTAESQEFQNHSNINDQKNSFDYNGLHLKALGGITLNVLKDRTNDFLAQPKISPLAILGGEYGWVFKNKYFLGVEVNFMLYPEIFSTDEFEITLIDHVKIPSWAIGFIPNVHGHVGYIFDNNIMVTAGMFYLWGIVTTLRVPINEKFSYEFRSLWFYDRVFFKTGIHDFHFTFGVDYKW